MAVARGHSGFFFGRKSPRTPDGEPILPSARTPITSYLIEPTRVKQPWKIHRRPRFPQEEHLIRTETVRDVRLALLKLDERDRLIIAMRFGIGLDRQYTLEDVVIELGLSKERVRQLEHVALKQLKPLLNRLFPANAR